MTLGDGTTTILASGVSHPQAYRACMRHYHGPLESLSSGQIGGSDRSPRPAIQDPHGWQGRLRARDRGCTRPGCTAPGYWSQAHHLQSWAAADGPTNIDKLTLACPPDNRMVEEGGWITRQRHDGTTEWIPPPQLDTGQARVNDYHHPERYLVREEDPGGQQDTST